MKGNTKVLRASKYTAKFFQIITDKFICGIISTNYLDLATVVLWKSTSYLTASRRILRPFFPTFHFFISFFSLLFFFFLFVPFFLYSQYTWDRLVYLSTVFCWFSDAWVELSPPQRLPLGVPIKITIMGNWKARGERWEEGKGRRVSLLSFPFPSCPARFLFLPSLPTTQRAEKRVGGQELVRRGR